MNQDVVKQFFDTWSIYDEVLERNYMFHAELFAEVKRIVAERFKGRPFSVLDLGCGSARHLAGVLRGTAVERYVGFDLSEAALSHAARNLQPLDCATELWQTDLLTGLENEAEHFDIVFSSYAAHHLSEADKQTFLDRVFSRLKEDGVFLLIDVAREETEDADAYLDHYCKWIEAEWTTLPESAKETIFEHIRKNDFAETSAAHHSMAARAGFGGSRDVSRHSWHRLWEFRKS